MEPYSYMVYVASACRIMKSILDMMSVSCWAQDDSSLKVDILFSKHTAQPTVKVMLPIYWIIFDTNLVII